MGAKTPRHRQLPTCARLPEPQPLGASRTSRNPRFRHSKYARPARPTQAAPAAEPLRRVLARALYLRHPRGAGEDRCALRTRTAGFFLASAVFSKARDGRIVRDGAGRARPPARRAFFAFSYRGSPRVARIEAAKQGLPRFGDGGRRRVFAGEGYDCVEYVTLVQKVYRR